MIKRITAGLLAFLMSFLMVFGVITPVQEVQAAGTTLIVHYGGREDNSYDGWNLWLWEEGSEGKQLDFTTEDEFGKIAIYQCKGNPARIGYIVRLNGWEAKDVDSDRFAEVTGDVIEIWVTSGVEEVQTSAPDGYSSYDFTAMEEERLGAYDKEGALKINLHYYNYDEDYEMTEGYAWLGDGIGGTYPVVDTDEFGAVIHIGFTDYEGVDTVGLKMYEKGSADASVDRKVDISQAADGVLDIYTVQGNPKVWYNSEEADKMPVITSAAYGDTTKKLVIEVSKPIDTSNPEEEGSHFTVSDQDGKTYEIVKAWSDELGIVTSAYIIMKEPLSMENTYTITREGYGGATVGVGDAYSSDAFEESYYYDGDDLGAVYTKEKTAFRLWAPTASEVQLNLYQTGDGDDLISTDVMTKDVKGTWVLEKEGDLNGTYYTYSVTVEGVTREAVDPYARTTGVNGDRGMVLDLASTNPEGFADQKRPAFGNATDAVIYEAHVRDLTIDESSGAENKGKYLGLTETGTTNSAGLSTGLDYIKDLGVTHIQLLPVYDYATVDESKTDSSQYNWGYDPKNYNVPEGSYSTDPFNGEVRVKEFKEMVQSFHGNEIRVVMDVVYNHTYSIEDFCYQSIVPDYFFRKDGDSYSNGSGCGNETASDRAMVRKYIVDSVVYWVTEYHIDGFRFDLMGAIDMETMKAVREALDEIDPTIIIYGEGWTGGDSVLNSSERSTKNNTFRIEGVGAFSDDIRDGIKGNVFDGLDQGFVNGKSGMENAIRFGVVGATENDQVDYENYEKSDNWWAGSPGQSINYVSCHDNYTFWDKLSVSNPDTSVEDRTSMNKLASAIVFTSQGVSFFQAGEEILRSKPIEGEEGVYSENSYNMPDYTNAIRWDTLTDNQDVRDYYKGLIAFRKEHGALRMTTTEDVQDNLKFLDVDTDNVVAYTISGQPNGEKAEEIFVVYNANPEAVEISLPSDGKWNVYVNGEKAGTKVIETVSKKLSVQGISAMVLVKESGGGMGNVAKAAAIGAVILAAAGAVWVIFRKRKK